MITSRKVLSIAFTAALVGGAGLGSAGAAMASPGPVSQSGPAMTTEQMAITIDNFVFTGPGTVNPGGEITVTNNDTEAHSVTADNGSFDVTIPGGASATFTAPSEAGTYGFFCKFHGNMKGSLTVGAEGMAQMHDQMMLDHPDMAQMHDQMMLDHPDMAQMHDQMMMGGAGMAQMHEKMMLDHPDMAQIHEKMMLDHPDMAQMHDQMMGGAESGSAEGNGMDQMGAVPKGGVDTGVSTESTSERSTIIALGGGLVLLAAAGGTYVVRRRSSNS